MSTIQPEALRLADMLDSDYDPDWFYEIGVDEVVKELRRLHAENSSLKVVFDEWIAKTEWVQKSLKPRELGKHRADILHARIADLEAQLASIGAGYTAADMATAAAQGFRDGVASLSLPAAGQEPVAWMWQHDETGRTGFVDCWQVENGWQAANPRLKLVRQLYAAPQPAVAAGWPLIARALDEWHEDDGPVMWWAWNGSASGWAGEPAWCGTPLSSDWPGYHTHWTPHPALPLAPSTEGGARG